MSFEKLADLCKPKQHTSKIRSDRFDSVVTWGDTISVLIRSGPKTAS